MNKLKIKWVKIGGGVDKTIPPQKWVNKEVCGNFATVKLNL